MQYFTLIKHTNSDTIFSGYYTTFKECLEHAMKNGIDLTHLDLKNKDLRNANLDNINLINTNFSGSDLTGANLSEANMQGSVFTNCALYNTCMSYSNLQYCNFMGASFGATMIEGAKLSGSSFSTLSCFDLDFMNVTHMKNCIFTTPDQKTYVMSSPPIILKGVFETPVVIMDNAVKIGMRIFPKTILPTLFAMIRNKSNPLVKDVLSA